MNIFGNLFFEKISYIFIKMRSFKNMFFCNFFKVSKVVTYAWTQKASVFPDKHFQHSAKQHFSLLDLFISYEETRVL